MIGHYLLTLTEKQEDRVLTQRMEPGSTGAPCLVAHAIRSATDPDKYRAKRSWMRYMLDGAITGAPSRYDKLCARFGTPRVNAAIRNRILTNRAWRTLSGASRETQSVGASQ